MMFTPPSMPVKNEGITLESLGEHLEHPKACHGNRNLQPGVVNEGCPRISCTRRSWDHVSWSRVWRTTPTNLILSKVVYIKYLWMWDLNILTFVAQYQICLYIPHCNEMESIWLTKDHHLHKHPRPWDVCPLLVSCTFSHVTSRLNNQPSFRC